MLRQVSFFILNRFLTGLILVVFLELKYWLGLMFVDIKITAAEIRGMFLLRIFIYEIYLEETNVYNCGFYHAKQHYRLRAEAAEGGDCGTNTYKKRYE